MGWSTKAFASGIANDEARRPRWRDRHYAADTPDTLAANPPPELEDSAHTGHARTGGSEHTTQTII